MNVANVQPEYDDRAISADFRAKRASQTTTGRLNRTDRPENDPFNTELQYGQPATVGQYDQGPWVGSQSAGVKKVNHKNSVAYKAGKYFAQVRVSTINTWVIGWSLFYYFSIQWWISLVSLSALGATAAVYVAVSTLTESIGIDGATSYILDGLEIFGSNPILAVAFRLFGIEFDPILLFLVTTAALLLLGVLQLLIIWTLYSLVGVNSLSGQAKGYKIASFILAAISSVTPIPLVFLWLFVVWKYPK